MLAAGFMPGVVCCGPGVVGRSVPESPGTLLAPVRLWLPQHLKYGSVYLSNNLLVESPAYPDKNYFILSLSLDSTKTETIRPCNINLPRRQRCELETSFDSLARKVTWLL